MRISDWSSDVCSSDLLVGMRQGRLQRRDGFFLTEMAQKTQNPLRIDTELGLRLLRCPIQTVDDRCKTHPARGVRLRIEKQRSEEHTSELQSLMRISSAVFCLKKKKTTTTTKSTKQD